MATKNWMSVVAGLLLSVLAIWQFRVSQAGLQFSYWGINDLPLTYIAQNGEAGIDRPLVLVAHGYAGSRSVMRGFGLALAHAGYGVMLWDFSGHGANTKPFTSDRDSLLNDAETALEVAQQNNLGGNGRYAILGHSMGSGVALTFGQKHPETAATIAVSPVSTEVTPALPHNLLLMAGRFERQFLRNAQELLAQAGGQGSDPSTGSGRRLVEVPGVEHITILFSPTAHKAAREWLDEVFGPQPGAVPYTDRRLLWYGLGIIGCILVAGGLAPLAGSQKEEKRTISPQALWRRAGALIAGAIGATIALWLCTKLGLQIRNLLGIQVGGYLLVWFGLAGIFSLLLLGMHQDRWSLDTMGQAFLVTLILWLGVGLLGQSVWLHWLLIPGRLMVWPLGAGLMLPWMLAVGRAASPAKNAGRVLWWLAHSAIVAGALLLALRLSPELGFLTLILPIFPLMLGLHALASAAYQRTWVFALSGALFLSWAILAVFPLAGPLS